MLEGCAQGHIALQLLLLLILSLYIRAGQQKLIIHSTNRAIHLKT